MTDDPESVFLREMAHIDDIKAEIVVVKEQVEILKSNYIKLDKRVKRIESNVKSLKIAHDSIAAKHSQELMNIKRLVIALEVNSEVDKIKSFIECLSEYNNLAIQLISDATKAKIEIQKSDNPTKILIDFKEQWVKNLIDLGVKPIQF